MSLELSLFPESWLRRAMGRSVRFMLGRTLPDLLKNRRSRKSLPGLDLPDPCPDWWILGLRGRPSMHSRPPRSLSEPHPPPDLHEGSQRHTRRPTSAKPQSGKMSARPPRKSGGRENSCRANPGPTWASCSLGLETGFPHLKTGFPFLRHILRFGGYLPERVWQ